MPRLPSALRLLATVAVATVLAAECPAVEMFTFFGDGSRIGLPSLEVPVEAYPGIPLRSDRLRARRAARRLGATNATAQAPAGGITIRQMPAIEAPVPQPRVRPAARRADTAAEMPLPPSPEDVIPGDVPPPLAE